MKIKNHIKLFELLLFIWSFSLVFGKDTIGEYSKKTKIDSLTSEKEVEIFIQTLNPRYKEFSIINVRDYKTIYNKNFSYTSLSDSLGIFNSFYKADFDKNGYRDILVTSKYNGFSIFLISSMGNGNFRTNIIERNSAFHKIIFPKLISKNGNTLIECSWIKRDEFPSLNLNEIEIEKELLISKFNSIVEYNPNPFNHKIDNIYFYTSKCFGNCPSFELEITSDRRAFFNAISDNKRNINENEIMGEFKTITDKKHFDKLIELLNYLDYEKLKNNYSVNWTDDQRCELEIAYDNGKVKRISDYGLIGIYGLARLYEILFDLRFNQNWK